MISAEDFEALVADAIDAIPDHYAKHMKNVGFVIEESPSPDQRTRLHLVDGQTLYGLYEGIPLTRRNNNYSGVLPDKITIFRQPMLDQAHNTEHLKGIVKNTVWHEVAHHFGLDHGRIHELEGKKPRS
jgi:predicted Zn-dependent protease with MMP-like domain